jgi:hypothetical protein
VNLYLTREEIAKVYRNTLGPSVNVITFGGPLRIEDIERIAVQSPALIVTCLGVANLQRHGGTVAIAEAMFGVFCVASDHAKDKRDAKALMLTEMVMVELVRQNWNELAVKSPTDAIGSNLYSTKLDSAGISLWAVRWRQLVNLRRNTETTLDDFESLHQAYILADALEDTEENEDIIEP